MHVSKTYCRFWTHASQSVVKNIYCFGGGCAAHSVPPIWSQIRSFISPPSSGLYVSDPIVRVVISMCLCSTNGWKAEMLSFPAVFQIRSYTPTSKHPPKKTHLIWFSLLKVVDLADSAVLKLSWVWYRMDCRHFLHLTQEVNWILYPVQTTRTQSIL